MPLLGTLKKFAVNLFMRPWLEFNASPPPLADGEEAPGQCDALGAMKVAPSPLNDDSDKVATRPKRPLHFQTANFETGETNRVILAAPGGHLMRVAVRNKTGGVLWAHVYNQTTSPPSANTIPIDIIPLPATSTTDKSWPQGLEGVAGLVIAISANEHKYDATGLVATNHWFLGEYYPGGG